MNRLFAAFFAFACASAFAADATDTERLAEARALIGAMQLEKQIDGMAVGMAQAMTREMLKDQSHLNQRVMQITMEESLHGMKHDASSPGGLFDTLTAAYASQFTLDELRQIREFYQSPAGTRLLLASPEIMKQVFPQLAKSGRAMAPLVCARVKMRLLEEKLAAGSDMKCPVAP
jgi:hypothetical protein